MLKPIQRLTGNKNNIYIKYIVLLGSKECHQTGYEIEIMKAASLLTKYLRQAERYMLFAQQKSVTWNSEISERSGFNCFSVTKLRNSE